MSQTKKLTGAVAFLGLIAILDNFLIIELSPDFEQMVFIDADGTKTNNAVDGDEPQLEPFWIDKHEVTDADFAKFLAASGYQSQPMAAVNEWQTLVSNSEATPQTAKHSVAEVHHADALAYCAWLGKTLPNKLQVQFAVEGPEAGTSFSDGVELLHYDRTNLTTWIGMESKQGLVMSDGSTSVIETLPASDSRSDALLGFLCVKNVVRN